MKIVYILNSKNKFTHSIPIQKDHLLKISCKILSFLLGFLIMKLSTIYLITSAAF